MTEAPVILSLDAHRGIATLSFNRPSVFNALDVPMAAAFEEAVAELRQLPSLRAVVLTGAGKAFMAGGDVASFAANLDQADRTLDLILNHMHPALLALRKIDAPVIAAVNGAAAGAGLSLVLSADYVVASAGARFVLAYDKLGVSPDCGGSWFLARKVGRSRAFDLMLMGQTLGAADAQAAGIVNQVCEADCFASTVEDVATRVAQGPTRAFGQFKRLMDVERPLAAHLEAERSAFVAATATEDFRNAATAFVQKTAPSFAGR
ncbi:enoyl-CoA hydratase/isomerase family protein [Paracoccus sp. (in: a-proteobacteria)]|uniref:enoyl-CoA hydratase/isomerase family protein n=1 Tax=Paracoccus sp. TaxID=267 RepID=UPI002AFE0AAA|nr:enoyl-CoA hydratase-related protein [Paracoccus sp. (in: a-proteobacteria)]